MNFVLLAEGTIVFSQHTRKCWEYQRSRSFLVHLAELRQGREELLREIAHSLSLNLNELRDLWGVKNTTWRSWVNGKSDPSEDALYEIGAKAERGESGGPLYLLEEWERDEKRQPLIENMPTPEGFDYLCRIENAAGVKISHCTCVELLKDLKKNRALSDEST